MAYDFSDVGAQAGELLNGTIQSAAPTITYEQAVQVTTSIPFIIAVVAIWFLPLFLYFIIGAISHAKSPSGAAYSKPMIMYPNFWIAVLLWMVQGGLMLLIIFPVWLQVIS